MLDDRVELDSADDGVTWAAHLTHYLTAAGGIAGNLIGSSSR